MEKKIKISKKDRRVAVAICIKNGVEPTEKNIYAAYMSFCC